MELTIYKRYFFNNDCYKKHYKQTSIGVQVHSTGANNPYLKRFVQPDDGRIGVNKYDNSHNRPGIDRCASAYIGKQSDGTVAVYQTLPWNIRCWLSGKGPNGNANNLGYVGFEILEDGLTNERYFMDAVMTKSAALTAHLCTLFGVGIEAVFDHRELHAKGIASNHGDIFHWLHLYDLTMNDYRAKVEQYMKEGVNVTYVDCDAPLFTAECTCPNKYLNLRLGPTTSALSLRHIAKGATVEVLEMTNDQWWRCKFDGTEGYCMCQYLTEIEQKPVETAVDENCYILAKLDKAVAKSLYESLKAVFEA